MSDTGHRITEQVMTELQQQVVGSSSGTGMGSGLQVSHLAHLGGSLAGVVLVLLLLRITKALPEAAE